MELTFEDWFYQSTFEPRFLSKLSKVFLPIGCYAAEKWLRHFLERTVLVLLDCILDRLSALEAIHLGHAVVEQDERVQVQVATVQPILDELDAVLSTPSAARTQLELLQHHAHRL